MANLLNIDRRGLLRSAATMTAAGIAPTRITQTEALAKSGMAQPTKASVVPPTESHFDAVTILRFREIAERNRIRQEAGLPLLSISRELRRMKEAADTEKFRKFVGAHRTRVYEKMLARARRRRDDPNWTPTGMLSGGGLWLATQVDWQLRKLYQRITGVTLICVGARSYSGPSPDATGPVTSQLQRHHPLTPYSRRRVLPMQFDRACPF